LPSGNQEESGGSKKLAGFRKGSPTNEVAQDVRPQETRPNSSASTAPRNIPSGLSLGSNLTPENHAMHGRSSYPIKTYANDTFQSPFGARQGNVAPGPQDNASQYSDDRGAARTRYNTFANTQYYSPPPEDRRPYSYDDGDPLENPFTEDSIRKAFIR